MRIILASLLLCATLMAQNGAGTKPNIEQQKEFQQSLQNLTAAQRALELADARMQQVIFKIMAHNKLSPEEWEAQLDNGTLTFVAKKQPEPKK